MKDTLLFDKHKSLRHTRAHWDIFNALAEWAVSEAGGKKKVFGTKPKVAEYVPTDLGIETGKALEGNIANLGRIGDLLEGILPGWREMLATGSKNAMQLQRGEIPQDVANQVRRSTAFKSLSGGYGGSPMSKALTARDFGRTSLDLTQMGDNAAQRWAQVANAAHAPFITTGPQAAEASFQNKILQQRSDQAKYNVEAAPDPGSAGVFNLQTALGAMAASWGMSSIGGIGTGGGGKVGSGATPGAAADAAGYGSAGTDFRSNAVSSPWGYPTGGAGMGGYGQAPPSTPSYSGDFNRGGPWGMGAWYQPWLTPKEGGT